MRRASQGRTVTVVGLSAAAHLAALTALALYAPALRTPPPASGPPEPIIPILIVPRVPPPEAGGPPRPIRLHRRAQRFAPNELPIAPLVAPEPEPTRPARPDAPAALAPPQADPVAANARNALRGSLVGCANARALGLSREEREACETQLGKGARTADYLGSGLDEDKSSALARAAARKDAYIRYRNSPSVPPGTSGAAGDSGQPWKVVVPPTR